MLDPAKLTTSKDVKSGFLNSSFSNSLGQGRYEINFSALETKSVSILDFFLSTIATKPSNSAFVFKGSKYTSINPRLVSTTGPLSYIQYL